MEVSFVTLFHETDFLRGQFPESDFQWNNFTKLTFGGSFINLNITDMLVNSLGCNNGNLSPLEVTFTGVQSSKLNSGAVWWNWLLGQFQKLISKSCRFTKLTSNGQFYKTAPTKQTFNGQFHKIDFQGPSFTTLISWDCFWNWMFHESDLHRTVLWKWLPKFCFTKVTSRVFWETDV